jgi:hypothetical protein
MRLAHCSGEERARGRGGEGTGAGQAGGPQRRCSYVLASSPSSSVPFSRLVPSADLCVCFVGCCVQAKADEAAAAAGSKSGG